MTKRCIALAVREDLCKTSAISCAALVRVTQRGITPGADDPLSLFPTNLKTVPSGGLLGVAKTAEKTHTL